MYTPGGGSATELLGGQPTPCPSYVWRFHAHDRRHVYMCRERVVAGCMCLPCLLAVPTDASASGCDARVLHACVLRYVRGAQWHTRAVDRGAHRDAGGAAGGGSGQGAARRFASRAYGVTSARLCGGSAWHFSHVVGGSQCGTARPVVKARVACLTLRRRTVLDDGISESQRLKAVHPNMSFSLAVRFHISQHSKYCIYRKNIIVNTQYGL